MFRIVLMIFALLIGAGNSFAGLKSGLPAARHGEVESGVSRYEQERREYEMIYWDHQNTIDGEWEIAFKRVIGRYKEFLKKVGPDSEFADDAKLRVAEFYSILYQKEKAKLYLDDIIKNYPAAEAYSIKLGKNSGNKTAAWALYWRAAWFGPKKGSLADSKDLLVILEKHRDSGDVIYEVLLLFSDDARKMIIKNFNLDSKFYEIFKLKKAD